MRHVPPPPSHTLTSSPSSMLAPTTAERSLLPSYSMGPLSAIVCMVTHYPPETRSLSPLRPHVGSVRPTPGGSSIVTSSPTISSSPLPACSRSWTSASPTWPAIRAEPSETRQSRNSPVPAPSSGPSGTCPPSRRRVWPSTHARTSSPSASCSARCSPAAILSSGQPPRRPSRRSCATIPRSNLRSLLSSTRSCAAAWRKTRTSVSSRHATWSSRCRLWPASSSVDIAGPSVEPKRRRRWLAPLVVVLAALALLTGGLFIGQRLGESPLPSFQRLTFRRGDIWNACFAPDGQTIVYGASWDGQPWRLFTTRIGSRESRPLDLPDADIQAISRSGEMAILVKLPHPRTPGSPVTLARVSMAGGAPREVLDGVVGADFSPDGQDLAVVREVGGRRQLEYPIGKVLFQGDVWNYPRVSPNGELVAVDTTSGLSVVDRQGRRTILDEKGWASSWSPTGNEVWFTAPNEAGTNDSIYAKTLSGRKRVLVSSASSSRLRAVSRDGRALMTSGGFRAAMMALAPGETRERDVSWFDLSSVADLARDGSELLFQEGGAAGAETMATYLRRTDGSSPAVRIGEGQPMSLSFDGKWVLMKGDSPAPELSILPTGAGESRVLAGQGIEYDWAYFFPDGRRIIAIARRVGEPWRAYIQDLAGGPPRPFLPQGVSPGAISPDSRLVVGLDDATRTIRLYPADGGEPRSVPGPPEPGDPVSWSTDGRSLFCVETHGLVMKIFRRELGSGRRDLLREITPTDPAGIFQLQRAIPAADGRSYAYSYWRQITDLYVVDGLR